VLDRLLALVEVVGRLLLQLLELRLREREERLAARGERVGRKGPHRPLEGASGVFEHPELRGVMRAHGEPGAGGAEHETDQDSGDDHRADKR
jgi:hypothetical protein